MVSLLVTLIVGAVVGWIASLIMKTDAQMGTLANIVVGIVGSSLGFWLAGLMGIGVAGGIGRWVVAVVGAVVLLAILKGLNVLK